ncbi:ring finger domain containing protein [Nitzschia inconspicua]|uniref:Ring finger domain containing protein n=1 Tax=Nitzschia inconspicua TaxID=303405 RepID=A0A9K3KSM1_9STRA|nr:ring finger domain containing protein [Nitzschia inconspicua]
MMSYPSNIESTTTPIESARRSYHHKETSLDGRISANATSGTASITFILLLICLILVMILWALYTARRSSSPPVARVGDNRQKKKLSVEDHCRAITRRFDQLGHLAFLTEESFRPDHNSTPRQLQQKILKKGDSDTSQEEETLSDIDLEEEWCPVAGSGGSRIVVVNRRFDDNRTEEFTAPNCCAICLENYSCGDEVVWSANEKCYHVYHKDCIATYFAHAKKIGKSKKFLCPTCRQEYVVLLEEEQSNDNSKSDDESEIVVASSSIVESTFLND